MEGVQTILTPADKKADFIIYKDKTLVFVPHNASNSVFVVSTPFIVERTLAVLRFLDMNIGQTRILTQDQLRFIAPPSPTAPLGPPGILPGQLGFPGQDSRPYGVGRRVYR